jgi:hypothetical protein
MKELLNNAETRHLGDRNAMRWKDHSRKSADIQA